MPHEALSSIKKYPLTAFFLLTFLFSWGILRMPPLDLFGPALAALLLTGLLEGKTGISRLLKPLLQWRAGIGWYLFVIFGLVIICAAAVGIYYLVTGELVKPVFWPYISPFCIGLGEEIGWRGFALPRLQKKYGTLKASLVIGVLWALWHRPFSFPEGLLFLSVVIAGSFLWTWVYNNTRGSLLLAMLLHAASNIVPLVFNIIGNLLLLGIYAALLWVVVIIVIIYFGPTLTRVKKE